MNYRHQRVYLSVAALLLGTLVSKIYWNNADAGSQRPRPQASLTQSNPPSEDKSRVGKIRSASVSLPRTLALALAEIENGPSANLPNYLRDVRSQFDIAGGAIGLLLQQKVEERMLRENPEGGLRTCLAILRGGGNAEIQALFDAAALASPANLKEWINFPRAHGLIGSEYEVALGSAARQFPQEVITALSKLPFVRKDTLQRCFKEIASTRGVEAFADASHLGRADYITAARRGISLRIIEDQGTSAWATLKDRTSPEERSSLVQQVCKAWVETKSEELLSILKDAHYPDAELRIMLLRGGLMDFCGKLSTAEIVDIAKKQNSSGAIVDALAGPVAIAAQSDAKATLNQYLEAIPEGSGKDSLTLGLTQRWGDQEGSSAIPKLMALVGDPTTQASLQAWTGFCTSWKKSDPAGFAHAAANKQLPSSLIPKIGFLLNP